MTNRKRLVCSFVFIGIFGMSILFPFLARGAEDITTVLIEAKNAIDQARMAGAEKNAPDDLAQARSWLAQAEKKLGEYKSILSRTKYMLKSDGEAVREINYLASMAKVKAQTAEAKSKRIPIMEELKDARKDLADYQKSLAVLSKKIAESERLKAEQTKIDAERKALDQDKRKLAELDVQKKKDLEESTKKAAAIENLKQKELAQAQITAEHLELRKKIAVMEKEKAMQADAAKIPHATVKSKDKEIVITILTANILTSKNVISSDGKDVLDKMGAFLKKHAVGVKVVIRGYTDSTGKAAMKKAKPLSEKLAHEVKQYLVESQGIPTAQLSIEGLGAAQPVASNATATGRAMNRRVEIFVPLTK